MNIPMLVTEHVPSKLGKIVSELDTSNAVGPIEKTQFSMCTPEVSIHFFKNEFNFFGFIRMLRVF